MKREIYGAVGAGAVIVAGVVGLSYSTETTHNNDARARAIRADYCLQSFQSSSTNISPALAECLELPTNRVNGTEVEDFTLRSGQPVSAIEQYAAQATTDADTFNYDSYYTKKGAVVGSIFGIILDGIGATLILTSSSPANRRSRQGLSHFIG